MSVDSICEWSDIVRRLGKESRARQDALDARHDRIIEELEAIDSLWFMYYEDGPIVARVLLQDPNDLKGALSAKRNIVAKCVIPAMYACIRAGFVTPKDQTNG